jgi:hypothetical protein
MMMMRPADVAENLISAMAPEKESRSPVENQPVAVAGLVDALRYSSGHRAGRLLAPEARLAEVVPPAPTFAGPYAEPLAPPTYPTMAQNLAASAQDPSCLAYVQAAERAGEPVEMQRLQAMGMDLFEAKVVAGMLLGVRQSEETAFPTGVAAADAVQLRPYPRIGPPMADGIAALAEAPGTFI